jgi:uncharacterized protein YutE (UPF0331/DUF86 family)
MYRFFERNLQVSLETILDIGSHIISYEQLGNPEENSDIILILVKNNIIKGNTENYIIIVKYQNILIHDYTGVNQVNLLTFIKNNISDLKANLKCYKNYISNFK